MQLANPRGLPRDPLRSFGVSGSRLPSPFFSRPPVRPDVEYAGADCLGVLPAVAVSIRLTDRGNPRILKCMHPASFVGSAALPHGSQQEVAASMGAESRSRTQARRFKQECGFCDSRSRSFTPQVFEADS